MITKWSDEHPVPIGVQVQNIPTIPQTFLAFNVPERGNDAALKATMVALRRATTVGNVGQERVEAHVYGHKGRGPGAIYLMTPGARNVKSNRRYAYPGDSVLVCPETGKATVVGAEDFVQDFTPADEGKTAESGS